MRYREDIETRFTARHKACIEFSGDAKDRIVLDVGCWVGWYEKFMAEEGCKFIVGIDLYRNALCKAKKSFSADRCDFVCASAHKLPFKPGGFDAVSMFDVLEHLPTGSEFDVLSEANKVLNTNGLLLVSVPNNHFISKLLDPAYFLIGHRHYALNEIRDFLEKTGFNICEVKYGGGVAEALSMVLLYLFKHLFSMEVPFKSLFEYLRSREYQGEGFATLFIKATKSGLHTQDVARKRIILLFNSFVSISGGDTRFIEIFKRLKHLDKVVITPLLGRKICEMKKLNATYVITTKEEHSKNVFPTYFTRLIKALFLKIQLWNEDILYSTSDFLPDVLPAFVYKLKNKNAKWVALLHLIAPNPFYGPEQYYLSNKKIRMPTVSGILYKLGQLFSVILMKWKSDKILVVNSEVKNYLTRKGVNKRRIIIVGNGIDLNKVQEIKQLKRNKYDACFVGRFHQQKGIVDLIKIWELVCEERPDAKLALIGGRSKKFTSKVEAEITIRKLAGNVDLLGFIDEKDKILTLKLSKIFLFPSTYESWGMVAAEAMACGLPVVAYDLPVYRSIYPKGMVRIPLKNIDKFAKWVLELLGNEELYNKLSKEATEIAKTHDWNEIAIRELEIIEKVLRK